MQELRIDDRDRAVVGGPEWVPFDKGAIDDTEYQTLAEWEAELGMSITWMLSTEFGRGSAWGLKAYVWLARKVAGIATPPLAAFELRFPRRVRVRPVKKAADADPPPQGSSEPPSA